MARVGRHRPGRVEFSGCGPPQRVSTSPNELQSSRVAAFTRSVRLSALSAFRRAESAPLLSETRSGQTPAGG
jgi:hypothetical protein